MIQGIFNSLYLSNWLQEFRETEHYKNTEIDDRLAMSFNKGSLVFPAAEDFRGIHPSEVRGDNSALIYKDSLEAFIAFLKTLKEQPVTIRFGVCGWIKICDALY